METAVTRILLVEDNPGDARLIRETLREAGSLHFDLAHVARLGAAREAVEAERPGVILLDLSLPDAHGLDTVRQAQEIAPDVPIIVLTGHNDESLAVEAVKAGAQDYLVKGTVDSGVVVRAIRYAIERKRLERERSLLLERERQARATAEAAVLARDEVLRVVSHDIGNSLSAVRIHALLLQRAGASDTLDPAEVQKRTEAIQSLVKQMHHLRQDLLDVASIEAGRLSMAPEIQAPEELVRLAVEVHSDLCEKKALSLREEVVPPLPPVYVDRQRVLQVLGNLVGNAIKFTPEGGAVTVRVAPEPDGACFSVTDTGPGIPPEQLPHLFDRFWKGRRGDHQGAGLGLAIARGIVEAQSGRLWVESEVGVGTTFSFLLPAAPAEPALSEADAEHEPG